jgi:hypothetical protein
VQDNDDDIEEEDEGWIYLSREEVRKLQEQKNKQMSAMLDRLALNTNDAQP